MSNVATELFPKLHRDLWLGDRAVSLCDGFAVSERRSWLTLWGSERRGGRRLSICVRGGVKLELFSLIVTDIAKCGNFRKYSNFK